MNNQAQIQQKSEVFYSIYDESIPKQSQKDHSTLLLPNQNIEHSNQVQLKTLYEVSILKSNYNQDCDITTVSNPYKLSIKNRKTNKQWTILRTYQDFMWLFNALKIALPGYILPYFPKESVTKFLQQKLIYFNNKERGMYLISQEYQLRNFLASITQNQIYGFTEQLRIFFLQNQEEFINGKRKIDTIIEELNITQNLSFSITNLIQKSFHFFTSKAINQTVQWSKQWLQIKNKFSAYSLQLYSLVEKMTMFKRAKEDEVYWKGTNTDLDSIQKLKAKIQSSKPFTQILTAELQVKILFPLITQCKKQAELQQLIQQKQSLEKLLKHLIQHSAQEDRTGKLLLRKQKFETHFCQGWENSSADWLALSQQLNQRFQNIYQIYSKQMFKIWK